MTDLESLYRERFSAVERQRKDEIWQVLCQDFFQQFVRADQDTVLDIACGLGEFTRHIKARRKVAIDLNPEAASLLPPEAEFHLASAEHMALIEDNTIDVCFSSNFLEHLPSKDAVTRVLAEVRRVLRPGGLYVALQPNIRLCSNVYWDFADHHTALSDRSCREMFLQSGLAVTRLIPRFLPFSTKSSLPNHPALVRAYLRVPLAWRIMGKQFLIVGKNDPAEAATTIFRGGAELVPPRALAPGISASPGPRGDVLPNL
jgi:ubiquinone/menaquinone biosynthesis C-methylase UbiE